MEEGGGRVSRGFASRGAWFVVVVISCAGVSIFGFRCNSDWRDIGDMCEERFFCFEVSFVRLLTIEFMYEF